MASSRSDTENSRSLPTTAGGRADVSGDEIDLIDYLTVLWRRKHFILLGTVLPSLLVFSISYLSPGDCRITYTYDIRSVEQSVAGLAGGPASAGTSAVPRGSQQTDDLPGPVRTTASDRFYSDENLDKLAAKLKESGFGDYALRISQATVQLEISETCLTMTVTGTQAQDVQGISSVVRDNLEKVLPMYFLKDQLRGEVARLKTQMADIEEAESGLELELAHKKAVLARLKVLAAGELSSVSGGLTLHFDNLRQSSEYLPVSCQVQAVDANIVYIEETIKANRETYDHCAKLRSLNEMLLEEVADKASSYYTIENFHSFVTRTVADHENSAIRRHLSAYAKRIENIISAVAPVVERPRVSPVPKGSLRRTGIAFAALLMVTTFGAFVLEAARKSGKREFVKSP